MKWQPIKTAPLNVPIIVTDGSRQFMAMQKTSWVYSDAPPSCSNSGGIANIGKPFTPTLWMAMPDFPKRAK